MLFLLTTHYLLLTVLAGCSKNPVSKLIEPVTVNKSQSWTTDWRIYEDELKTNGGVLMIGWGNGFVIDFESRENPYQGVKCMKVYWDGGTVTISGGSTDLYTGFSLIAAKDYNDYLSVSKDLSPGGYTKLSFYARKSFMSANTVLRIESPNGSNTSIVPNNVWQGTLTETWAQYSMDISGSLSSARHFVNIVLKTTDGLKGNGAIVYIDEIRLTK